MSEIELKLEPMIDFCNRNSTRNGWVEKHKIQLAHLKAIASNVVMLKKTKESRWRFTLIGTSIVDEYKKDFTGFYIEDIPYEECRALFSAATHNTSEKSQPFKLQGKFCNHDGDFFDVREIAVPVSDNGKEVTHVLIYMFIDRNNPGRFLYDEKGHDTFEYTIESLTPPIPQTK